MAFILHILLLGIVAWIAVKILGNLGWLIVILLLAAMLYKWQA